VARALNAASGVRPAVILANLSGFDGSPESMRKLQLEYGAEIARAVVNFAGPLIFLVVSRYHGGAYVVFSRGSIPACAPLQSRVVCPVIGGGPAAVYSRAKPRRARSRPRGAAARGGATAVEARNATTPPTPGAAQSRASSAPSSTRSTPSSALEVGCSSG
jgi:acetyl-CoA carboxylase carboxyltransferase component